LDGESVTIARDRPRLDVFADGGEKYAGPAGAGEREL